MNKIAVCLWLVCCWSKIAFAQTDTVPPVLHCKPYEQLLIKPYFLCSVGLLPTDLIDTVWDNSGEPVLLGGRKACSGDGFPEGPPYLYYTINELGGQAKGYIFPNIKNPFEPPFPEAIAIYPTTDPPLNKFEFIGIKIGDVNGTANSSQ